MSVGNENDIHTSSDYDVYGLIGNFTTDCTSNNKRYPATDYYKHLVAMATVQKMQMTRLIFKTCFDMFLLAHFSGECGLFNSLSRLYKYLSCMMQNMTLGRKRVCHLVEQEEREVERAFE